MNGLEGFDKAEVEPVGFLTPYDKYFINVVFELAENKHTEPETRAELLQALTTALKQLESSKPKRDLARTFFRLYQSEQDNSESAPKKTRAADIVSLVKFALTAKRENNQALEKARFDGLTDLLKPAEYAHDVDFLVDLIHRENHRKKDEPFCLVMIDLDHFKDFNDAYGHLVGDVALRNFAKILKDNIRSVDKAFRYGGEEFSLIINGGIEVARFVVARIMDILHNQPLILNPDISPQPLFLTASFGIFCSDQLQSSDNGHSARNKADQALYAAKRGGRNRLIEFDQDVVHGSNRSKNHSANYVAE